MSGWKTPNECQQALLELAKQLGQLSTSVKHVCANIASEININTDTLIIAARGNNNYFLSPRVFERLQNLGAKHEVEIPLSFLNPMYRDDYRDYDPSATPTMPQLEKQIIWFARLALNGLNEDIEQFNAANDTSPEAIKKLHATIHNCYLEIAIFAHLLEYDDSGLTDAAFNTLVHIREARDTAMAALPGSKAA